MSDTSNTVDTTSDNSNANTPLQNPANNNEIEPLPISDQTEKPQSIIHNSTPEQPSTHLGAPQPIPQRPRHLVISGGAMAGIQMYGAMRELHRNNIWQYSDIKSIWATSVGTILGICVALKYEWESIDDYFINRPWNTVVNFDPLRLFTENGFLGESVIRDMIVPLLVGNGLNANSTLFDLFTSTGIDCHFFTTRMDSDKYSFETVDLNHNDHPDWKVVDAVYASCCFPLLFVPFRKSASLGVPLSGASSSGFTPVSQTPLRNEIYLDGGIFSSFPMKQCIEYVNRSTSHNYSQPTTTDIKTGDAGGREQIKTENLEKIIGFNVEYLDKDSTQTSNKSYFDLLTYVKTFISSILNHTDKDSRKIPTSLYPNIIIVPIHVQIEDIFDFSSTRSPQKRRDLIEKGAQIGRLWTAIHRR
jgi:predicted acylesterase/phospholipase RssA